MSKYEIHYQQTEFRVFTVEAENRGAALEAWRRGEGEDTFFGTANDQVATNVVEVIR